ncbi:MAG TPA: glutamate synthase subunit beta [Chloroflexota bacterium]|nr:glutamate synthase subunit beta [Chloroflexota bacterium]
MGKITGFIEIQRDTSHRRPVDVRLNDYREIYEDYPADLLQRQGARCMDCGIPFCHKGCPLGNIIPEWNDLVYRGKWRTAIDVLHSTNSFPEFTGRVCPAPCEESCTLSINSEPVTIKQIELGIVEHAFREGLITPRPPTRRTGKKVAVVGSGPSGLAAAAQINAAGHTVTVFERADRPGGILRYGIPDFKLEKWVVERRVKLMEAEGVTFRTSTHVGVNYPVERLRQEFDAIILTGGATNPRDLNVPGRDLKGVHFAMDFLPQQNRRLAGLPVDERAAIMATGKRVVIIGGGDTGADCLGTCHRQGAKEVYQFELLPKPPEDRPADMPWPLNPGPAILRTSTSHEEGGLRDWSIDTTGFAGDEQGRVKALQGVRLEWAKDENGRLQMSRVPGSEFQLEADLVLLALGFLGPEKPGMLADLGVELDQRGNVKVDANYMSSLPGVFAAGDMRRGQSLVVWAIWEGREAARGVDRYLMGGETVLPSSPDW